MQELELEDAKVDDHVPSLQDVHVEAPLRDQEPAKQSAQKPLLSAPESLFQVPALQLMQNDELKAPNVDDHVPERQRIHEVAPVIDDQEPAGQL